MDRMALSQLGTYGKKSRQEPSVGDWVRIIRNKLRMTQAELARRAHITQPHLASIEAGKGNPQLDTIRRLFESLHCSFVIEPNPEKPLDEILRGRARSIALKRLKQSMGTMALEGQAPEAEMFKELLEKNTDDILQNSSENLWAESDG